MSHSFRDPANHFEAAVHSVRQLIANGNTKGAVENAKAAHKAHSTGASEALLVEAYYARIQSLRSQNLEYEAKSLEELVRSRYPSAQSRLVEERGDPVEDLLAPLNDPSLPVERRAAIEQSVQRDVHDLAAIAECTVLPPEHPLRKAAVALLKAFSAATTTPTAEADLALPEVSRRSPLAPWKMLVRSIGHFYRHEDDRVRECLSAIPPESAPARLVPAMREMLGETGVVLTSAAGGLASAVSGNSAGLRSALEKLDRDFHSKPGPKKVLADVKTAVQECAKQAPAILDRLRQHIAVRGAITNMEKGQVASAMGGSARDDAYFFRLWARTLELAGAGPNLLAACTMWESFRSSAVQEGWFPANGQEVATLYLHMAGLLRPIPERELRHLQNEARFGRGPRPPDDQIYFLFPDQLYQRACTLDPHIEAFSQWLDWARGQRGTHAESVAKAWHKIRPMDMEPILYLMHEAQRKNAFPTALRYLAKAEQIDNLNSSVRRARLQLLSSSAIKHLQQKKPHLARQKLAEIEGLPQARQGDRPAFLATLRYQISLAEGDEPAAATHAMEIERLMGGRVAAWLLRVGVATAAKQAWHEAACRPEDLGKEERAAIPAGLARAVALAADLNAMKLNVPWPYINEAAKQLARQSQSLDVGQLRSLAEAGVSAGNRELTYAASRAGLEHGGPAEARFLLLRAKSLHQGDVERRAACTAAAVTLARGQNDLPLVNEAVEYSRESGAPDFDFSAEQAAEVVRLERAAIRFPRFPGEGPKYDKLLPMEPCQCAGCRGERGEGPGLYDDEDDDFDNPFDDEDEEEELDAFLKDFPMPPGTPREFARIILGKLKEAVRRGDSPETFFRRMMAEMAPPRKPGKGRRK